MVKCRDCDAPYGKDGWVDVSIQDEIWNTICPEDGVLCFRCMTKRIETLGLRDVPVIVSSGPYRDANEKWRIVGWDHGYKVGFTALAAENEAKRMSLAQEIAGLLKARGFFCPKDYNSPNIINAVGLAMERLAEENRRLREDNNILQANNKNLRGEISGYKADFGKTEAQTIADLRAKLQQAEEERDGLKHRLELATNAYLAHKDKDAVELKKALAAQEAELDRYKRAVELVVAATDAKDYVSLHAAVASCIRILGEAGIKGSPKAESGKEGE